ncbi:IS1182 family transposase [Veillonella sp. LMAG:90]|uniref:IS1182 family transposase n=1 Tax=Veillonella sp. LMAG:90 TaxID=1969174 RepID=UPI0025CC93B6|nr:IS1182 family transposase [Veillonella sp. LMAG:90]
MNRNHIQQGNYTKLSGFRQVVLSLDYGFQIGPKEPVRLLDAVLEELDYTRLQHLYSSKGRKSLVPPHLLFKVYVLAMTEGIVSVRKIAEQCTKNIHYMWLLQGYPTPSHMVFHRFFQRLTVDVLRDLLSQFIQALSEFDSLDFSEVFIDGTKWEAYANKYTFVWKKSILKHYAKLPDKLLVLQCEIQNLLNIDVSDMTADELLVLLDQSICEKQIEFVHGTGKRKHPLQRAFESCLALRDKRNEYDEKLAILGSRNSYSKTDHDATFMRLKEDHMLNGQLKPAYNVQLAVHSEYIMGVGVFPNPTDTNTLIPFMQQLEGQYKQHFQYVVADAGYDSNENLAWLWDHDYKTCIKPSTYELSKTKKYKKDIGRADNMVYDEATDTFTCAKGRTLRFQYIRRNKSKTGFIKQNRVYRCENCNYCGLRKECQKLKFGKPPKGNKTIYIATDYRELLAKNKAVFDSDYGLQLRVNRSIQVEGAFGITKEDVEYTRFRHRGKVNVEKDLLLLAFGYNLLKLHNRIQKKRLGQRLFETNSAA